MKALLFSLIVATHLCAFTAEVKNESVILKINEKTQTYKAGQTLTLKAGDIVCFLEGEGRVVLKGADYEKQLTKRNQSCKQMPSGSENGSSIVKNAQQKVASIFAKTKENESSGVSRKSASVESAGTQTLNVSKDDKYIAIGSDEWGPLPVKLQIIDRSNKVKETFENEEEMTTSFLIPSERVGQGEVLRIVNAFGDVLMEAKIEKTGK